MSEKEACPKSPTGTHLWVTYGVKAGRRCIYCQTIRQEEEETHTSQKEFTGGVGITFFFEAIYQRDEAKRILAKHGFHFDESSEPEFPSLVDIDDPDYMLEILATEGFDTSKILVERP